MIKLSSQHGHDNCGPPHPKGWVGLLKGVQVTVAPSEHRVAIRLPSSSSSPLGESPISDFRKKLGFCPSQGGGDLSQCRLLAQISPQKN